LNVHGAGGVRQTEIHTSEPFVPEPSASEIEDAIGKLKSYKSPGVDQIPAELIQAGGETLRSEIRRLIKLIWRKEELRHQWKESIVVPIHKKDDKNICSNHRGTSLLSTLYKILSNILLSKLNPYADKLLGITDVDFGVTEQRLIKLSISGRYWRKHGSIMAQYISYL
jgi:hypothetical protein